MNTYPLRVYGEWSGNPRGVPYDPERCAKAVYNRCGGIVSAQCSRRKGYGHKGLFCYQHRNTALNPTTGDGEQS